MTGKAGSLNDIKIAVTGGNGWLGQKISWAFGGITAVGVDIADGDAIGAFLDLTDPDVVINAAGRAGPPSRLRGVPDVPQNIDYCNLNERTRAETHRSNVEGPRVLGRECTKRGIRVVHLSSGCLWNGPSPHADGAWRETDDPAPVSFYAEKKVEGERALIEECGPDNEPLITRIRLPIDGDLSDRNLLMKLRRYPEIMDVTNSVTVVASFIFALKYLVQEGRTGIYHVTNPGPVSHRELMAWYCELVDPAHRDRYELVPEEEIFMRGRATEGRSSCVLNTDRLWNEAKVCLSPARPMVRSCLLTMRDRLNALHGVPG